ncbi:hypothetical protein CEE45_12920 [Candidatus Heimdallarchaeota archaeon B3_Heim]|nr:MAG: hypothetical protein CEE45_12920 [Candidatus Heimdallarchaeota archaeon B3_Heim]
MTLYLTSNILKIMHLKKIFRLLPILFFNLLAIIPGMSNTIASPQELSVGELAPNFDMVNIYSNTSSQLSDYLGKVVILDLFATWCGPCIQAIPQIKQIQNSCNSTDLEIISIDIDPDESYDKVISFVQEHNMSWIVSLDESNMNQDYGTGYIPTMYIINQSGFIVYTEIGFDNVGIISALDQLIVIDYTYSSLSTSEMSVNTSSKSSPGFIILFNLISSITIIFLMKKRKISPI